MTYNEVRALLEPHAREGVPPTFLWRRVQGNAYVIHVPPSGIWGYGAAASHRAGKVRGEPPEPQEAFDRLVSGTSPPTGRRRSRTSASGRACRG